MKKLALASILAIALSSVAMASDIAFYIGPYNPGWYGDEQFDHVETIIAMTGYLFEDIQQFDDTQFTEFGAWIEANTNDGEVDIIWLNGTMPSVLYAFPNVNPDGSPAEAWLDGGNMFINVGDWFGYCSYEGGVRSSENAGNGAANILDLNAGIIVSADTTALKTTPTGTLYLPSLPANVETDRPVALAQVVAPWEVAAAFATSGGTDSAAETYADPVVIHNTATGGYLVIVNQDSGSAWLADRGVTCAEFIANWASEFAGLSDPKQAKNPSPENGETDVLRNVTLSWVAGLSAVTHNVYFGDNFDDVNNATVANPLNVLVSQGQAGLTFELPERLEFATTYYWRVDEVGPTLVKGKVWSFTTELLAYPIENVVVTSNATSQAGQGPERIVDGSGLNANDGHSTNTAEMWGGIPNATEPTYLLFEFDGVYKLHELLVWNYNMEFEMFLGLGVKNATFEYSEDGENWTVLGDFDLAQATSKPNYLANTTISFGGAAAKYVRMTINSSFMNSGQLYGLSEVRFTSIPVLPSRPSPADGATNVSVDSVLSWRTGREAASHEVHLGTDPAALDMVGATTQSSYSPTMDLGATYSWQIVEVNNAEAIASWAGPVWTFTTQRSILVEGFEAYDDDVDAGTAIWQTWIDGIDDGTNGGAVVGWDQSPFAEQTIVRSGGQSMPFRYANTTASAISETDYTLSPAQNWTKNGVKSLSLSFYGTVGNTGRLYVKINNGSKIPYNGDAADIGITGWLTWNIVLANTGANLNNVTSLSIGVDGIGSGTLYIDDIRLYPSTFEATGIDIAISAQANWWSQAAADREIQKIVDKVQGASVEVFSASEQAALAAWVEDHTANGVANLLILCGQLPATIYSPGNGQADNSLAEMFVDNGNTIINTGDWIFYVVNSAGTNGAAGLQTIMDIPAVTVAGGDNTPVTVTADGRAITPSLQNFATDRPFHLDTLDANWSAELILAQDATGLLADPVIVRNSVTGGRIGVFHQSAGEDDLPRGDVISEWINNWYLNAAGN